MALYHKNAFVFCMSGEIQTTRGTQNADWATKRRRLHASPGGVPAIQSDGSRDNSGESTGVLAVTEAEVIKTFKSGSVSTEYPSVYDLDYVFVGHAGADADGGTIEPNWEATDATAQLCDIGFRDVGASGAVWSEASAWVSDITISYSQSNDSVSLSFTYEVEGTVTTPTEPDPLPIYGGTAILTGSDFSLSGLPTACDIEEFSVTFSRAADRRKCAGSATKAAGLIMAGNFTVTGSATYNAPSYIPDPATKEDITITLDTRVITLGPAIIEPGAYSASGERLVQSLNFTCNHDINGNPLWSYDGVS